VEQGGHAQIVELELGEAELAARATEKMHTLTEWVNVYSS